MICPANKCVCLARRVALALLVLVATPAFSRDAQIVLLVGKADYQEDAPLLWQPAKVDQFLMAGASVRTSVASQMALLLRDQTQIRLNEQTQIRVTSVASAQDGTTIDLAQGRIWAQARQYLVGPLRSLTSAIGSAVRLGRPPLMVRTPTSTIGIRGTDWEVLADEDRTVLTVLSGEVEISNDFGQVVVGPNEQAVALRGRAPYKALITQAKDRVQWVTAYRPMPRRWLVAIPPSLAKAVEAIEAGDFANAIAQLQQEPVQSPESRLLWADLLIYLGRASEAVAVLEPDAQGGRGEPMAVALQARALTVAGQLQEADTLLARAAATPQAHPEILLAQADIARVGGDASRALALFASVSSAYPASSGAWFGVGRIQNEKELVQQARTALDEALRLEPDGPGYLGERATVEALAGNLVSARALFAEALQRAPSDFVAWTGLGILQLKAGEASEALQSFLRAGVIEPGFARAQLYTGVAYYQLGLQQRALESVLQAAGTDPLDPLPHVMLALIRADARQLGAAIDAAREAQLRLPYLKSLNQLLSDQKGNANLGSSLAAFGMEEWATWYADAAYSPYWAGSHLFLADRHTGDFNKNSELYKGFITDPTVFGAPTRFSSLVAAPGHHGRVDLFLERNSWAQAALIGTVNGLVTHPAPIAYFFSGDLSAGHSRQNNTQAHGNNVTVGLGARPRHDVGVFAFGTNTTIRTALRDASFPDNPLEQNEDRGDLGVNLKIAPDNQLWLKTGAGQQRNAVSGGLISQPSADALDLLAAPFQFSPDGSLDHFHSSIVQHDAQFRHAFSQGPWAWTWGVEYSRQTRNGSIATTFNGVLPGLVAQTTITTTDRFDVRSTDAYLGTRYAMAGGLEVEGALYSQRASTRRGGGTAVQALIVGFPPPIELLNVPASSSDRFAELNVRAGVKLPLTGRQLVRLVAQKWRRPASAGTLAPIDTLGIALNDRLPIAGGMYQRMRLQYDAEATPRTFLQVFADSERVDNGLGGARNTISVFELTQLQSLRERQDAFSPKADLEDTPVFRRGTVRTLGLALNHRRHASHTLALRYLYRDSSQGGPADGLAIPFLPRHMLRVGSQWSLPGSWLVAASATYRSERFRDDTHLSVVDPGWAYGLTVSWESEDKRANVQTIIDNILSRKSAGNMRDAQIVVRLGYRF